MTTLTAGDTITPHLAITDLTIDDTTTATLTIYDPDDDPLTATATPDDDTRTVWTANTITVAAPGEWRMVWTVTNGAGQRRTIVRVITVTDDAVTVPTGFSYATTGDWAHYTRNPLPDDGRRTLIAASREIDRATRTAVYATDDRGYATDPDIRRALADATCELVLWWAETGLETGAARLFTTASIAGVNIGYASAGKDPQADRVGPKVKAILATAGLARGAVRYG